VLPVAGKLNPDFMQSMPNTEYLIKRHLVRLREICARSFTEADSDIKASLAFLQPYIKNHSWVAAFLIDTLLHELDEFWGDRWLILNLLREELPDHEGLKFLVRYFTFGYHGEDGMYSCYGFRHFQKYCPGDPWFRKWITTFAFLEGDHAVMWKDLADEARGIVEKWAAEDESLLPLLLSQIAFFPSLASSPVLQRHPEFRWMDYELDSLPDGIPRPNRASRTINPKQWNPACDPTELPQPGSMIHEHSPQSLTWPDFDRAVHFPSLRPDQAHEMISFPPGQYRSRNLEFIAIALWSQNESAAMDYLFEMAGQLRIAGKKEGSCDENDVQLILQKRWPLDERVRLYSCANLNGKDSSLRISAARFLCTAYADHPDTRTLMRAHIRTDAVCLGLYLSLDQQYGEVSEEIFGILQNLANKGGVQAIARDAPVLMVRKFGPRRDLLGRLAALAEISLHRELERTIVSLLETYVRHSPYIGLQGILKEGRLSALEKLKPHSYQPEAVLPLAQHDPIPEVQLKALQVLWALGDRQAFPAEALRALCPMHVPAYSLLKETVGDDSAVLSLLDFCGSSWFTRPCPELTTLVAKDYAHTLAGQKYLANRLKEPLESDELNVAAEALAPHIRQYPELKRKLCGLVWSSGFTTANCLAYLAHEIADFSSAEKLEWLTLQAFRADAHPEQNADSAIIIMLGGELISNLEDYAHPIELARGVLSTLMKIMTSQGSMPARNLANFMLGQILFSKEPIAGKIRENFPEAVKATGDFLKAKSFDLKADGRVG